MLACGYTKSNLLNGSSLTPPLIQPKYSLSHSELEAPSLESSSHCTTYSMYKVSCYQGYLISNVAGGGTSIKVTFSRLL
jgi:hypothetical protein